MRKTPSGSASTLAESLQTVESQNAVNPDNSSFSFERLLRMHVKQRGAGVERSTFKVQSVFLLPRPRDR